MTDLITKVKAALEGAAPRPWVWWTSNSWRRLKVGGIGRNGGDNVLEPYVAPDGYPDCVVSKEDMDLIALAPDMARAIIVAEQTAGNSDWLAARIREFDGSNEKGAGVIGEHVATAFRAAMEGRTDD